MFNQINLQEAAVLAKVLTEDRVDDEGNFIKAYSLEKTLSEIELIDDLLTIMKSKSLMMRKRGLRRVISGRIEMELQSSSIVPGSSNLQLKDI